MTPNTPAATERVSDLRSDLLEVVRSLFRQGTGPMPIGLPPTPSTVMQGLWPLIETALQKRDEELRILRIWQEESLAWAGEKNAEVADLRAKLKEAVEVLEGFKPVLSGVSFTWWRDEAKPFLDSVRDLLQTENNAQEKGLSR